LQTAVLPNSNADADVDLTGVRTTMGRSRHPALETLEGSMKYLCLIYADESAWMNMSKTEADSMVSEYMAFTESIEKSGHYIGGNRLQPIGSASTVRVRSGQLSTTDGPFAETKEQLGGYYLIDARDLNDAIQVASKIPGARVGSIEVRPIAESHLSKTAGN
jgi:hypothetical protein